MKKNRIDVVTLGCSKNLVDSEMLMKQLLANGYTVKHDPEKSEGEIVVVNTCGFIGDAKEESINKVIDDILDDFEDGKGIGDRGCEIASEFFDDFWYDAEYIGREDTGILNLYMLAFKLATEQLNKDNQGIKQQSKTVAN